MSEIVFAAVLLTVLPVCGVAAMAIWASSRTTRALVETNAMLSYTTRCLADAVLVPREEQVDRIRELNAAMNPTVDTKPRSVGAEKGGYLPGYLDRDFGDDPAGGGV
jgi:hypothetical protein